MEKLTAAQTALMELQAGGSTDQAAVNAAADRVAAVATELDATGRGRQQLRSGIAQLEGHDGEDVDLHRQELAARLVAAEALVDERRRQQRHMPAPPPGDDAGQVRLARAIGKARGDLARSQVQMMLSRDDPAGLHRWVSRHREAAMAALDLHAQLRTARAGGAPAPGFLSESEQRVWRRGGADEAAMVALSHRRAVIHDHPDAFDTVIPLGTRDAREAGEVYQGAKPEPVEDLYSDPAGAEGEPGAGEESPSDTYDDHDGDTDDDDEPADIRPEREFTRTEQPGRRSNGQATADLKRRRKAQRRQHKQAQQRAGQRRKREIREVSVMVHRVKRLTSKADQGQGTGIECGGVLMLDYFQTNLG